MPSEYTSHPVTASLSACGLISGPRTILIVMYCNGNAGLTVVVDDVSCCGVVAAAVVAEYLI